MAETLNPPLETNDPNTLDSDQIIKKFRQNLNNPKLDKQQIFKDKIKIGFFLNSTFKVLKIKKDINFSSNAYSSLLDKYLYTFDKVFAKKKSKNLSNSRIKSLITKDLKMPGFELYLRLYSKLIFKSQKTKSWKLINFFKNTIPQWFGKRKLGIQKKWLTTKKWFRRKKIGVRLWFRRKKAASKAWFGRRKANINNTWTKIKNLNFLKKLKSKKIIKKIRVNAKLGFRKLKIQKLKLKIKLNKLWLSFKLSFIKNSKKLLTFIKKSFKKFLNLSKRIAIGLFIGLIATLTFIFKGLRTIGKSILKIISIPLKIIWKAISFPFAWIFKGLKSFFSKVFSKQNLKKYSIIAAFIVFSKSRWFWYSLGFIAGIIVGSIKKLMNNVDFSVLGDKEFWRSLVKFNISNALEMLFPNADIKTQVEKIKNAFKPAGQIFNKLVDVLKTTSSKIINTLFSKTTIDNLSKAWDNIVNFYTAIKEYKIIDLFKGILTFVNSVTGTIVGRSALYGASAYMGPLPLKLLAYLLASGIAFASAGVYKLFSSFSQENKAINLNKKYRNMIKTQKGSVTDESIEKTMRQFSIKTRDWTSRSLNNIPNNLSKEEKEKRKEEIYRISNNLKSFNFNLKSNIDQLDVLQDKDSETSLKSILRIINELNESRSEKSDNPNWEFFTNFDKSDIQNPLYSLFDFNFFYSEPTDNISKLLFHQFKSYYPNNNEKLTKKQVRERNEEQERILFNFTNLKKALILQIVSLIENAPNVDTISNFLETGIIGDKSITSIASILLNKSYEYRNKSMSEGLVDKIIEKELNIPQILSNIDIVNSTKKSNIFANMPFSGNIFSGKNLLYLSTAGKKYPYNLTKNLKDLTSCNENRISKLFWTRRYKTSKDELIFKLAESDLKQFIPFGMSYIGQNAHVFSFDNVKMNSIMDKAISMLSNPETEQYIPENVKSILDTKKINDLTKNRYKLTEFNNATEFVRSITNDDMTIGKFESKLNENPLLNGSSRPDITFMITTLFKILAAADKSGN